MRRLIPVALLVLAGCSNATMPAEQSEAGASSETLVLAPMTSVPMDVANSPTATAEQDEDAAASEDAEPAEATDENAEPAPKPEGTTRYSCKQFSLNAEGKRTPADDGPVRYIDVSEDGNGKEILFVLNDHVPPNFSATLINVESNAGDEEKQADDVSATRRLTVMDAQVQQNSLRAGDNAITLVGDFYRISPEAKEVALTVPAGKTDLFSYDAATVAGFVTGTSLSQCVTDSSNEVE